MNLNNAMQRMAEFHEAFDVKPDTKTHKGLVDLVELRARLLGEEYTETFDEFCNALDEIKKTGTVCLSTQQNLLKEMTDMMVIILGTCDLFGWDAARAFELVMNSNMSKLGEDGKPVRREDGKVLKGPNYKPADLFDCVVKTRS